MKNLLINLHNHLLDGKGEYYSPKEINEKINNFKNINCEKIYAFTDHFSLILKLYSSNELEEYKKRFKKLSEECSKKNISILIGLEIDVCFDDDSPKHLICLFRNEDDWFFKIKNYFSKEKHLTQFYFFDESESWLELLENTICIPHYLKQEERSFTKEQISIWNKFTKVPKIKCLEIASNLKNYFYFLSDKEINGNYHCIVANDRSTSLLGSFICFDDHNDNTTNYKKKLFDIIFDFFNQSRHKASLSTKFIEYEVLLNDIKISVNVNKNCLVYGKRGSGKSYLCELLNKAFVGSNIQGEQENSKICYIKQGDYIKEKNWEAYCWPFRDKMQNIFINCCQVFKDAIAELNLKKYDKKTIDDYCNNEIKKFVKEIGDNERDECQHLRVMDALFTLSHNSDVSNMWIEKYDIYKEFIKEINEIFNKFKKIKKVLNDHNDDVEKIINNLCDKKPYFLQKLEESYIWKKIICYRKETIKQIHEHIKEEENWEHNLDFDFFQYFKVILLKKQFNNFVSENKEIIKDITSEWNEKYRFKYTIEPNGYFQIKELKDPILLLCKKGNFIRASDGEQREFLILNKLSKSNATFFILDEPEYAFDNVFLKRVLAKK